MKALANTSRLFMVEMLSGHERCVDELSELIGSDLLPVSMHLRILKNAGIVTGEKRDSYVYYALRLPSILDFFSFADAVLEESRLQDKGNGNEKGMVIRPRTEEEICE